MAEAAARTTRSPPLFDDIIVGGGSTSIINAIIQYRAGDIVGRDFTPNSDIAFLMQDERPKKSPSFCEKRRHPCVAN